MIIISNQTWLISLLLEYGQITAECSNIQIPRLDVTSDSMFLNEIYISEMGTSVWYTSSTKYFGGIYCLYDTKTGEIISEIEVSEDTFVIPGGFSGHVDGFLSPSKLCMYLGTIKRDVFISKVSYTLFVFYGIYA